jgi:hypothetical protein
MTDTTTAIVLKPGYKTTEFWLSLAAMVLGAIYSSGAISDSGTAAKIAGLAASVLGALGYAVSRGLAKAA